MHYFKKSGEKHAGAQPTYKLSCLKNRLPPWTITLSLPIPAIPGLRRCPLLFRFANAPFLSYSRR